MLHVTSAGAGPPLVLLHGWAMNSAFWEPLLPRLAARFRVHAVDLPGHGASASVAPYTLETITGAIAARFAGEREPPTVVGWSLGGTIAMRWAQRGDHAVARLVLVSSTPCFVARSDWPHAMLPE